MRSFFISLIFLFQLSFTTTAQLIVDDNGRVGIGDKYESTTTVPSSYEFEIDGPVRLLVSGSTGFQFDDNSGQNYLMPLSNYGGSVGSTFYKMDDMFANTVNAYTFYTISDSRFKTNLRGLENALDNVLNIKTYKYDMLPDAYEGASETKLQSLVNEGKDEYGVLAQELREFLPDLVNEDQISNILSVNYTGLIPLLIKAIQEQQAQIDSLEQEIEKLK